MKFLKWIASFLVGCVIFITSGYLMISLLVAYWKLTGSAVEGERMYFDMRTPTWGGLLAFQAVAVVILVVAFFLRSKLQARRPPG